MGSPLSPVLANIYMEYFEEMALGSRSLKPSMRLRYIDDTFILWPHQEDVQTLFDQVNSMDIGMMVRVFANGLGDLGSIPSRVIPKTQKMVLDTSLLNAQHHKVQIKGKEEQFRERSSALPNTLV